MSVRAFIVALGMGATSLGLAQGISFTFDSDNQGWTKGNFGSTFAGIDTNISPADHDPVAKLILGADHSAYAYHFSPDLGGGYGSLFGEDLSVDFASAFSGGQDPFLVLVSSSDFLVVEKTILASPDLVTHTFKLDDTTGFYFNSSEYYNGSGATLASNAQIQAVLSDLRYIGVSTDINGGADSTRLDNVSAVPEPGTIALGLAAAGALALGRRKAAK